MRECRNALIQVLKNYEVDLTFHLKQRLHLKKKPISESMKPTAKYDTTRLQKSICEVRDINKENIS